MILFKDAAASLHSIYQNFCGDGQAGGPGFSVWYMDGVMPNSLDDLSFDVTNPLDIASNAKGLSTLLAAKDAEILEISAIGPRNNDTVNSTTMLRTPYQDSTRNDLYRVFPKWSCYSAQVDAIENENSRYAKMNGYRYVNSIGIITGADPDLYLEGNVDIQYYTTSSRYPYNYPTIMEFDEVVSIAHVAIQQSHSGTAYTNSSFSLTPWDETLNNGDGGWGTPVTVSYSQGNVKNEITLAQEVVGKRFRLSGSDTGSQAWINKYLAFYSSSVPTNLNETLNLGWALVTPYWYGVTNVRNGSDYDTNLTRGLTPPREDVLPVLMCSVGDSTRAGTLMLENASNLTGKTHLEFSAFSLTYGEPQ